jgi:hypothetical protein
MKIVVDKAGKMIIIVVDEHEFERRLKTMLAFAEVKKEIKQGCNYVEHESKWYGGIVNVILDGYNEKIIIDLTQWNESKGDELDGTECYRIMDFSFDEFLNMSYKELVQRCNYCLFY